MQYRTESPVSYADKLSWTEVTRIPPDGTQNDPNEHTLFCEKCQKWTPHVFLGDGWLCYTSECGGYIPETKIENWKEFDKFAESLGG